MEKAAKGEDDSEAWGRLKAARTEIDGLAEEKLQIVKKIYNLAQRFVYELSDSIRETEELIGQQRASSASRG